MIYRWAKAAEVKHLLVGRGPHTGKRDCRLLDEAERFEQALLGREVRKLPTLRGRTVMTVFFENSTRTRVSFEVAGEVDERRRHQRQRHLVRRCRRASPSGTPR